MRQTIVICSYASNSMNIPTISAFALMAKDRGIHIILLSRVDQDFSIPKELTNVSIKYLPRTLYQQRLNFKTILYLFKLALFLNSKHIKTLIGVDAAGVVAMTRLSKWIARKPFKIYLSFEMFFLDEPQITDNERRIRAWEKTAVQSLDALIIQDKDRLALLKTELPIDDNLPVYFVPVSQAFETPAQFDKAILYKKLGIPGGKITLLTSGSIKKWAGFSLITEAITQLKDSPYWFVLHDARSFSSSSDEMIILKELQAAGYPLSISAEPLQSNSAYFGFIQQFDLGLALYQPDYEHVITGKNVLEMGLSSGKLNAYLMLGLPVIFSNSTTLTQYNEQFHFGYALENYESLVQLLQQLELKELSLKSNAAANFYEKVLDPKPTLSDIFTRLIA